jgi:signal peptidase
MLSSLASSPSRILAAKLLNFAFVLSTEFILFKGLAVIADCPSPNVVVLSSSMEPAMQSGDLVVLWNRGRDVQVGETVVYNVKGRDIPIVHRVAKRVGGGYVR